MAIFNGSGKAPAAPRIHSLTAYALLILRGSLPDCCVLHRPVCDLGAASVPSCGLNPATKPAYPRPVPQPNGTASLRHGSTMPGQRIRAGRPCGLTRMRSQPVCRKLAGATGCMCRCGPHDSRSTSTLGLPQSRYGPPVRTLTHTAAASNVAARLRLLMPPACVRLAAVDHWASVREHSSFPDCCKPYVDR